METKEIKTKKETEEVKNVYMSADGLSFENDAECKEYEGHLYSVLKERLRKIAVNDTNMCDVFAGDGSEDNEAFVLFLKSKEEVETVRQFLRIRSYGTDKQCDRVQVGKALVLGIGYDDDYVWITDLDDMIQKATKGLFKVVKAE